MKKLYLLIILATLLLGTAIDISGVNALSWSFEDAVWQLWVTGPNIVKPGDNATFTVTGKLWQTRNESIHIKIYLNTTTQTTITIKEEFSLPLGSYIDGDLFIKNHTVQIPINAINNDYIYINIDTIDKHFESIAVTLVQDPSYSSLETLVNTLQTQITNLNIQILNYTTQISTLNTQISTLQLEKISLQTQVTNITSQLTSLSNDKTMLQNQVTNLQQNVSNLNTQINTLTSQRDNLQGQVTSLTMEKTNLVSQVNTLTTDKNNLTAQVASLTNESGMYKNYAYGLGVLALIAIVVAIYFIRKPQSL